VGRAQAVAVSAAEGRVRLAETMRRSEEIALEALLATLK